MSSVSGAGAGQSASPYYASVAMPGGGASEPGQSNQTDSAKHAHKHRHKHTNSLGNAGDSGGLLEQLANAVANALQDSSSAPSNSSGNGDSGSDSSSDDDSNETIQTAIANILSDEATGLTGRPGIKGANGSINPDGTSSNGNSFLQMLQQYGVTPEQFRNDFLTAAQNVANGQNSALNALPPGSLLNKLG